MEAFPYSKICRDCQHIWGGYWFSFTVATVLQGQANMSSCPKCKGNNVGNYNGGKGELEWEE